MDNNLSDEIKLNAVNNIFEQINRAQLESKGKSHLKSIVALALASPLERLEIHSENPNLQERIGIILNSDNPKLALIRRSQDPDTGFWVEGIEDKPFDELLEYSRGRINPQLSDKANAVKMVIENIDSAELEIGEKDQLKRIIALSLVSPQERIPIEGPDPNLQERIALELDPDNPRLGIIKRFQDPNTGYWVEAFEDTPKEEIAKRYEYSESKKRQGNRDKGIGEL